MPAFLAGCFTAFAIALYVFASITEPPKRYRVSKRRTLKGA